MLLERVSFRTAHSAQIGGVAGGLTCPAFENRHHETCRCLQQNSVLLVHCIALRACRCYYYCYCCCCSYHYDDFVIVGVGVRTGAGAGVGASVVVVGVILVVNDVAPSFEPQERDIRRDDP